MKQTSILILIASTTILLTMSCITSSTTPSLEIGNQTQLFVDDYLINNTQNVTFKLHSPEPKEKVITFDEPWEGELSSAYVSIISDDEIYRMYYRGLKTGETPRRVCYAESKDGIHWIKPKLKLHKFNGSYENNIVHLDGENFAAFKDSRPGTPESQRYKAFSLGEKGLMAHVSSDGLHWQLIQDKPVITEGSFDSQNIAFWDQARGLYQAYFRVHINGYRSIGHATSLDFVNWTTLKAINTAPAPLEHIYTQTILPYFRAPQNLIGFPMRLQANRNGITDGIFMSSRDGVNFDRRFLQSWIRPNLDPISWKDRNNMPAWGMIQTAPDELSIYYSQHYRFADNFLRRATLRLDGFASLNTDYNGGVVTTKPFRMKGTNLIVNYATGTTGSLQIEVQDLNGNPIKGFNKADATEFWGNELEHVVTWKTGSNLTTLNDKPIRLKIFMKDADLYSFRFGTPKL